MAPPIPVQTSVVLQHIGYRTAELERGDKIARNLRLLELEHHSRPTDPYVLYQLGRTHYAAGDWPAAQAALATAAELLATVPLHTVGYLPSLLRIYAQASLRAGAIQTAFNILDTATDMFPDYTDLYFAYGLAILETGDPKRLHEVRDIFEGCLAIGEPDPARYETVTGVGSFLARHNLGAFYEAAGNLPQARVEYHQAADAGYLPSVERLAALT
jgi:tetratricopeptide (TPR) repeat protein